MYFLQYMTMNTLKVILMVFIDTVSVEISVYQLFLS